ncbi:armadillo-type protein [Mycena rebaudengoi]|nr:armadillo-type protein [Mycena rebaudengoi]
MALAEDVGQLAVAVAGQVEEYKDEIGADTELLKQILRSCLELEAVHVILKVCAAPSTAFMDPNLNMYLDGQNLFKRRSFTWFAKSPKNKVTLQVTLQRLQRDMKHSIDLFSLQSSIRIQQGLRRSEALDATRKARILDEIRTVCREVLDEIRDGTGEVLDELPRETVHRSEWSKFASVTTHSVPTILQTAVVVGEASHIPYLKGLAGIILLVSISVQATADNEVDCIRLSKMVFELGSVAARQKEDNIDSDQFSLGIQSLNRALTRILRALQNNTKGSYSRRFLQSFNEKALLLDCERELQHCLDVFQIRTHIMSDARKQKDTADEAFEDQVSDLAQNDGSDDGSSRLARIRVVDEAQQLHIRNAAGFAFKNALSARDAARLTDYLNRWMGLGADAKAKIKRRHVRLPGRRRHRRLRAAPRPVGRAHRVDPGFADTQANVNLRIATLQTFGFICESIKPEILTLRSNEILTVVIHGARKEEPSPEVQLAAIHALFNSLGADVVVKGERNYIMQVVCEATQSTSVNVQVGAFERCLADGGGHEDQLVALRAVEFWSTAQEAPERESKCFAKLTLPEIVPVLLLLLLTKQEEEANDDEEFNDAVVPAIIPFIEAHIKATDWHQREAAVMTFGSILEGPDPVVLTPLVAQALPLLIDMMTDVNAHVRDTTAWTLGRICDLLIQTIKPDVHLHPRLGAFDSEQAEPVQSGPLSPYYEGVVAALLRVTESAGNEANFGTAAYEAIAAYLGGATLDAITVVQNTVVTILQRMEQLLAMQNQIVGVDDRNNWNELQGNFCNLVIWAIQKLNGGIQPLADRIMTLVLQLIQAAGKTSPILEDAFLVVGALATALETSFSPYIQTFLPFLYPVLQAHEDPQLCTVAFGIIPDILRALGPQVARYANQFMRENLQREGMARIVCGINGDISRAVGPQAAQYANRLMTVLLAFGAREGYAPPQSRFSPPWLDQAGRAQ